MHAAQPRSPLFRLRIGPGSSWSCSGRTARGSQLLACLLALAGAASPAGAEVQRMSRVATVRIGEIPPPRATSSAQPKHVRRAAAVAARAETFGSEVLPIAQVKPFAPGNPGVATSFVGLSSAGSTGRVPDQGLCVGAHHVVEVINGRLRVFDRNGVALSPEQELAGFLAFDLDAGDIVFDPSCLYDRTLERWFLLATAKDGAGRSYLALAVSQSSNTLGSWWIYHLPSNSDGSDGGPVHPNCPCYQDYPHMAVDEYGLHIASSEKSSELGNDGPINGPQIFSVGKRALAEGAVATTVVQLGSILFGGAAGFGLWPAVATDGNFASARHGTQYFLQSVMDFSELMPLVPRVSSTVMGIVAVSNTRSLEDPVPALELRQATVETPLTVTPLPATQKTGDFPLGQCLNDLVCSESVIEGGPFHEVLERLQNFSHVEAVFTNHRLWAVLSTAVEVAGVERAGVLWSVIQPRFLQGELTAQVTRHHYFAADGADLLYPTIAMVEGGKGVIGFSLSGPNHYPSFGYVRFGAQGVGGVHVVAHGVGPLDDRSGYDALAGLPLEGITRFGDYGAAASDGSRIWIAGEFVGQVCTLAEYMVDTSCGGTRHRLSNYFTYIVELAL